MNGWNAGGLSGVDVQYPQNGDTLIWNAATSTWQNSSQYTGGASANVDFATTYNNAVSGTVNLTPTSPWQDAYPNIVSSSMNPSTGKYSAPVSGVYYYRASMLATPSSAGNQITALNTAITTAVGAETVLGTVVQQGSDYYGLTDGMITLNANNSITFQVTAGGTQSAVKTHVSIFLLYPTPSNHTFLAS